MFKVGDKVRRLYDNYVGMRPDDIGTIIHIKASGTLVLKEYCKNRTDEKYFEYPGHDSGKFELVILREENEL